MSNNVAWKMGVEAKCKQEPATVEITVEEFQALIEAKTKLEIATRFYEDNKYLSLSEFNSITGYEIPDREIAPYVKEVKEEKKDE